MSVFPHNWLAIVSSSKEFAFRALSDYALAWSTFKKHLKDMDDIKRRLKSRRQKE
jgi:hypothetical protein